MSKFFPPLYNTICTLVPCLRSSTIFHSSDEIRISELDLLAYDSLELYKPLKQIVKRNLCPKATKQIIDINVIFVK